MPDTYYEIWQDDMMVAGSDSLEHAEHYALIYSQEAATQLCKVERELISNYGAMNARVD